MLDTIIDWPRRFVSGMLIGYLTAPSHHYHSYSTTRSQALRAVLTRGDVLLVEGTQRFSTAVKYLTQSTWSHAAMYVGESATDSTPGNEPLSLIEADLKEGVTSAPLSKYDGFNTRICRPIGLSKTDTQTVAQFMINRLGHEYDLRNVVDLARYLLPTPPVPVRFRRQMLAFGSGDPTRVICSTLIAQAFQSIHYPILPEIESTQAYDPARLRCARKEVLHIRHHSLFAPRDFDISPYFAIIKPTIARGFDFRKLDWENSEDNEARGERQRQIKSLVNEQLHEGSHHSCAYSNAILPPRIE